MTNDELRELNKKRRIHQIAWVTPDLEKSMKAWVDNLQVGPWTVLIDRVLKEYREKGIEVTQTGQFKEDFHYYLNTEPKLEFVLELGNCPLLNLPKDEYPTYPAE